MANKPIMEEHPVSKKRILTPPEKPEPKENVSVTPRGKEIELKKNIHYGLYYFDMHGGMLPKELLGFFTEEKRAKHALEMYLNRYWKGRSA